MSYRAEPRQTDTQCPACGAPVTADAAFCPECGATQPPQLPPPRRRRSWMPVAIGAGAIAAILGGAVLGVVLLGPRTDAVADEPPGASSSASAAPSARGDASASPSPSTSASPSTSPLPATAANIPNLAIAEVTTDGLNLRAAANESSESLAMLEQGRHLFIIGQPTDAGDLRWYRVAPFDDVEGCESGCGLIGFVATPTSASEDAWIEEIEVSCPASPMTAQQIAALVPLEALHCFGRNEIVVTGTVDLPMHGPISPYGYSPGWLTYEHLEYLQHAWWISYRPHPDAGLETPARGEVVRVTGHFEDPAATDCRVTVDPEFFGGEVPADFVARDPNRVVLDCRAAFVWTDYEVTDVVDLGVCCGYPPEE
jgi:zinc-ribbon domain